MFTAVLLKWPRCSVVTSVFVVRCRYAILFSRIVTVVVVDLGLPSGTTRSLFSHVSATRLSEGCCLSRINSVVLNSRCDGAVM